MSLKNSTQIQGLSRSWMVAVDYHKTNQSDNNHSYHCKYGIFLVQITGATCTRCACRHLLSESVFFPQPELMKTMRGRWLVSINEDNEREVACFWQVQQNTLPVFPQACLYSPPLCHHLLYTDLFVSQRTPR